MGTSGTGKCIFLYDQDKELLLFDAVGRQFKWLHYYLKQYDYTRFKFLEGGLGHQ